MHRIDADAHVGNLFSDGNPSTGAPGTKVNAAWLNAVQEEICNLLTACGVALVKGTNNQLVAAAVAAATPNRLVRRDSAGRAQFGTPAAAADAATKAYVDQRGAKAYALISVSDGVATVVAGTGFNVASVSVATLGDRVIVNLSTAMSSDYYPVVVTPSDPLISCVPMIAMADIGFGVKLVDPVTGITVDMRSAAVQFSVAVF